jgi:glyoxylase I family protein
MDAPAMELAKLMIFVPDLEEARRFYADVLGFALKEEHGDRLVFAHGGCDLVAFRCDRDSPVGGYSREARAVFVFGVASIDAAMAELRARGVRFLHERPAENEMGRYAAFVDPFGIVHEIFQPARA